MIGDFCIHLFRMNYATFILTAWPLMAATVGTPIVNVLSKTEQLEQHRKNVEQVELESRYQ